MNEKRRALTGVLFVLPSFLGILMLLIIPFFKSIYFSFTEGITQINFVWFKNFVELFGNPTFALAVRNTVVFMGLGIPLLFVISLTLSLLMMNGKFVFARWALLTPLIVPISAVISGWQFILSNNGMVNGLISGIGFKAIDFFGEDYAMAVIIIMFIWKNIGYLVVIFTSAITVLAKEYTEVFALESKSSIKLATKVILPLITPMAFFALVISVMNSFRIFREIYVMYGNFPPKSIYMLQYFMNNNFFKLNYQRLSTAAFIVTIFVFIIIGVLLKLQNRFSRDI